ncbi:lamin tail-like protein [Mongoliibacter ruber]|uniref:Lamin tail-like protein n=2 Tax=Mongoliibacter ruber TaxID=1750599 RepID=A0A2T0WHX1_9BACT|nr:lamin tail-like protein [Mongoliibacter ruber]
MKRRFLKGFQKILLTLMYTFYSFAGFAQIQDFEKDFTILNHPKEFLPNWSANEVRGTSSRVFQAKGEGRFGSQALGVQAISSFNGVIYHKTSTKTFTNPKLAFFAKSKSNGTGDRPVLPYISFSSDGENYENPIQVGDEKTFANRNNDYTLFEIPIPLIFQNQDLIWIKYEIRFGPGTGSAARFFMDDVGLFESEEEVDPLKIKRTKTLSPYSFSMDFNRKIFPPESPQISISGNKIDYLLFPTDTTLIIFTEQPIPAFSTVDISNLKDGTGKVTAKVSEIVINEMITIGEAEILSPDLLKLHFTQFYSPSSVSQTANFTVNGKSPISITLSDDQFSILLDLNTPLVLDQTVNIVAENIANNSAETNPDKSSLEFLYKDYVEDVFALDPNTIYVQSSIPQNPDDIDELHFKIEEFPEFEFKVSLPDSLMLKLYTDAPLDEGINYTLNIPHRKSGRGLFLPGSSQAFVYDITPPDLIEVILLNESTLLLIFSEKIDPIFASILNNYAIEGTNPSQVVIRGHQIILSWNSNFQTELNYVLEINKISDLNGNFSENLIKTFNATQFPAISYKDIVINEIMPAPRSGNMLPNVEYVEVFNTTEHPVYLGGMQLANSRRASILPSAVIGPKNYLILSPRNQSTQFEKYGEVLGLTNWPTLLNTADQVNLLSATEEVLDSLNYNSSSFGSSSFASGGYSLELANPFLKCYLPSNLKVSQDPARGTPGKVNSVFEETPDLSSPKFLSFQILEANIVSLNFDKVLNQDLRNVNLEISPNLSIAKIEIGITPNSLILHFEEKIKANTKYNIRINSLRDCSGNLFEEKETVYFILPDFASKGDIVINEVLFNPRTGAPKFVEIYNSSSKFLNMKDWKLANLNTSDEVANRRILFSEDMILEPFSFLVFTTDRAKLKQEYPKGKEDRFVEYSSLPSFPISAGNVVLLNPEEELIEIFSYSERMHHPLIKEKRGISLERLSPFAPVNDPNNWQSASSSEGYASPGYKNSQNFEGNEDFGIEISPRVFVPEAAGEQPFTTISYYMSQSGKIATMRIYHPGGILIKELCQNAVWGEKGFYLWDGTDMNNRKVRPGHYIIWIEIFDLQGKVTQIRKTVVVGTKF